MSTEDKFISLCDEIDVLLSKKVDSSSAEFQIWEKKVTRFLAKTYGEESYELRDFKDISFSPLVFSISDDQDSFTEACENGLRMAKGLLESYFSELAETAVPDTCNTSSITKDTYTKVFIVHGHDGELKEAVARLVEKQGLTAVILNEQANLGATIIEKFENSSDVNAAICLFTADDTVVSDGIDISTARARQNVVFETGYFMGKLGRKNTILLADKGVEIPSDLQGVVYTDTQTWKFSVLQELKAIGYPIDYNKIDS